MSEATEVVAVIPAAGFATRLGDTIAGSKEVVEVGGSPAAAHLLRRLAAAGIGRAVIALRRGKWDVPEALRGPHLHGVDLSYVMVDATPSATHSLAPALRHVRHNHVALAFPDVIYQPVDALSQLATEQRATQADIVLGLFIPSAPERVDMVEVDGDGTIVDIVIKQPDRGLRHCWSLAVWTPRFTTFLLDYLADQDDAAADDGHELHVGEVVRAAMRHGFVVAGVPFDDGGFLDIGTPGDLARAQREIGR